MVSSIEIVAAFINGIFLGGVYALIAVGLSLCYGVMGILNFAHGSIVMLGMYGTYFCFSYLGLNPYLSILIVGPLSFLFGVVLQRFLFRFTLNAPHNNQILVTIGLLIFLNNLALQLFSPNVRTLHGPFIEKTFSIHEIVFSYTRILALAVSVVFYISLNLFLKKTYIGKAIRATAQSREGARISGINEPNIYLFLFGVAAMLAGAAGLLILPFSAVYPEVGDTFIIAAFIIIVLGGMGRIGGTFWAAMLIGISETLGATLMGSSLKYLFPFIVFILVLLFRPSGLFGKAN
jgi:branched-chain amino acid transport system permease protein